MPLFRKKEDKKVDEKTVATRSGNATGYQKTEEYRKGNTNVQKIKTEFDDGHGSSGKTKTKATSKETDLTNKKDLSAVSALTETTVDGNKTSTVTKVNSNYTFSATFTGTPKEIEKEKKKLKKQMENRKKEIKKEQKKLLQQGQEKALKKK
ncbi:unnamed protein product [Clavelina lepadiformis]|uniref:Uncharacterized protein n=1 Tax=Clavelina lepadiformis TaxID=159417 RepID=A0ABP0F2T9_CLALP